MLYNKNGSTIYCKIPHGTICRLLLFVVVKVPSGWHKCLYLQAYIKTYTQYHRILADNAKIFQSLQRQNEWNVFVLSLIISKPHLGICNRPGKKNRF